MTGIEDCAIVTWNDEKTLDDGIRIVPAWKWVSGKTPQWRDDGHQV
jgi:predicted AAA+ superfamily ATPase